jgi:hypothetical protein
VTAEVRPDDGLSLRVEYRYDRADAEMYFRAEVPIADPDTGTSLTNARSQRTITLGASPGADESAMVGAVGAGSIVDRRVHARSPAETLAVRGARPRGGPGRPPR